MMCCSLLIPSFISCKENNLIGAIGNIDYRAWKRIAPTRKLVLYWNISIWGLNFNIEFNLFLWKDFNNVHNNVMAHGVYNDDHDSLFPWLQDILVTEIC
jgi:hypothetical protein